MTDQLTAIHEASHALLAFVHRMPIRSLSLIPGEGYAGVARFNPDRVDISDLNFAAILVAGELGTRMAWGREPRINWFANDTTEDGDIDKAKWFLNRLNDPLDGRQLAVLKARGALRTRWSAVQALASELERRKVLVGEQVDIVFQSYDVQKRGQIDPEKHFVRAGAHTVSLREWCNALDLNAKNKAKAIKAIEQKRLGV